MKAWNVFYITTKDVRGEIEELREASDETIERFMDEQEEFIQGYLDYNEDWVAALQAAYDDYTKEVEE